MSPERGKFFPDNSADAGRLLSAGYHSVMGFWRDDNPLVELILDEKGKKELDQLWTEFDFYANHTARTFIQFYFNQSGEVQGGGSEAGRPRPVGREVTDSSVIAEIRDQYVALAKASGNAVAAAWMPRHFDGIDSTLRSLEKMRAAAEPVQLEALVRFAARAYRRPLTQAERDGLIAYYQKIRKQGALSHEDAMRDSVASILISPVFLYRVDLQDPATRRPAPVSLARGIPLSAIRPREPAQLFSVVQHARSGAAEPCRRGRPGTARRADCPDSQNAERSRARAAWPRSSPRTGSIRAISKRSIPWIASASQRSPTICERRCSRSPSGFSKT